ncbi:hypothetical protein R5R35_013283 [Gryllus longicercus]|uniref:Uncharacterized protein n=1 Tax=Gryllus longicercus TaxID=2509291 RepID=A0AAN9W5L4_9ORTH
MVERFRSEVDKFKDALSEFETDIVRHRLLYESQDFEESMLRVVELKRFSVQALRNYEETSKEASKETSKADKRFVELQTAISKIIAIQNARNLAFSTNYLQRLILREPTDRIKESKMLNKLILLQQHQTQIIELAKQERNTHLEVCEARSCLQKELVLCKKTMEKKTQDSKSKIASEIEAKISRKLEKMNIMRKLMIGILLCKHAPLTDQWLDFFPTLRDKITIDSFRN